ncbi:MAG: OmpH family outer membrane protein [Pseudomonadota bacterium]
MMILNATLTSRSEPISSGLKATLCLATGWFFSVFLALPVIAQEIGVVQSNVIVISSDRLFSESTLGKAYAEQIETQRDALIARNRRFETELEVEEKELTEMRAEMSADAFREMADDFDEKVQAIRRESERLARDLDRNRENAPFLFLRQVEPVIVDIMRETGAVIVIESRTVLLAADAIDVTALAIGRIDRAMQQGILRAPQPADQGQTPVETQNSGDDSGE